MNLKKAKRLRQLVRHLQETGAIENKNWVEYTEQYYKALAPRLATDDPDQPPKIEIHVTVKLNPSCGRAVYQQMKKRGNGVQHRAH